VVVEVEAEPAATLPAVRHLPQHPHPEVRRRPEPRTVPLAAPFPHLAETKRRMRRLHVGPRPHVAAGMPRADQRRSSSRSPFRIQMPWWLQPTDTSC